MEQDKKKSPILKGDFLVRDKDLKEGSGRIGTPVQKGQRRKVKDE